MIGGCRFEKDFKMNAEEASPGSESDGTGSSEGVDYLQMYFGQSAYNRILSPADRLSVGVSTGIVDGNQDEPIKPSDRMELDTELSSIFFGTDEDPNKHQSREGTETGGLMRNQAVEVIHDDTRDSRLLPRPTPTPEWTSAKFQAGWDWPNNSSYKAEHAHTTAQEGEQEKGDGRKTRSITRMIDRTTDKLDEDGSSLRPADDHPPELEETAARRQHYTTPLQSSTTHEPLGFSSRDDTIQHQTTVEQLSIINSDDLNQNTAPHNNTNNTPRRSQCHDDNPFLNPISSSSTSSHQFIPSPLLLDSLNQIPIDLQHKVKPTPYQHHHHFDPSHSFQLHPQMPTSSLPNPKYSAPLPLDLSQFWTSWSNPTSQLSPIDQLLTSSASEDDHNQHLIDLEFNHLVAEDQCAPSTPLSSNSFSTNHPATSHSSHRLLKNSVKSTADFSQPFLSVDPLSSLFPTIDQGLPLYPSHQPTSSLKELHDLNDTFGNFINSSFDLCSSPASSAPRQSVTSSALAPPFSNPFLSETAVSAQAAPVIDPSLGSQLYPTTPLDHPPHHLFGPSGPSTSSLPSPPTLSHQIVHTSQSNFRDRKLNYPGVARAIEPRNTSDRQKVTPPINRSQSQSHNAITKSGPATAEVPTEVELAIPRVARLNLSDPHPDDLKLFLIGLQAQGAKTRVETQIKLTLVLLTGQGGSIDRNGNLSTESQNTLTRIGNWSHIKLPVYSAIKRKSKKLIKTGIPPEETLFLDVAVVRASEPHEEIYCCSNCQVREQKRTQRKRDARVRPAQEIDSDEAEQSIRPEDEKRKIVVFNCGQYVSFESGEVTLPTRITCYCRHHREKKGFRVKITLHDHTHRLIATSTTPAIMITDDHKAVAAAAKAKSGSDAEDNHPRDRPIHSLPSSGSPTIASVPRRAKKRLLSASIDSIPDPQIASPQHQVRYEYPTGWESSHQIGAGPIQPQSQSSSRSTSTKCKRKASNEFNLRTNIGKKKTASNPTVGGAQMVEFSDTLSTDGNYRRVQSMGCLRPLQESRPHSSTSATGQSITMPLLATHIQSATPASTYLWHSCSSFPTQSWQEEISSSQHAQIATALTSIEMKHLINPMQISHQEHVSIDPLNDMNEEKSTDHSSNFAASDTTATADHSVRSQPYERSSLSDQACTTSQVSQGSSRPQLTCSVTSSPDRTVTYPCGIRVTPSPASACSTASPKSSVDSGQYNQFKCSNSTSRSSSIVCTQSRAGSDSYSHTSEINRSLRIVTSQDSLLQRTSGDQSESQPNTLADVSRTCSPVNNPSMSMLGNVLADWNATSTLLPPSSQSMDALSSPKSSPTGSRAANIHPLLSGESSTETVDQAQAKVSKLVPNEGPIEGGIEIAILGSDFYPGLQVDFGCGGPVTTEFWSNNALICILPPSSRPGPCEVSLVDAGAQIQPNKSSGQIFTYVEQADQKLMELALQVVGLKMTGQVQDPKSFARKTVGEKNQSNGSAEDSLDHVAGIVENGTCCEPQKIDSRDLKVFEASEDDAKVLDVVQDDEILRLFLHTKPHCHLEDENSMESDPIKLIDMLVMASISLLGGAYGLLITMGIITAYKSFKPESVLKFGPFGINFTPNLL